MAKLKNQEDNLEGDRGKGEWGKGERGKGERGKKGKDKGEKARLKAKEDLVQFNKDQALRCSQRILHLDRMRAFTLKNYSVLGFLKSLNNSLVELENTIKDLKARHNDFLEDMHLVDNRPIREELADTLIDYFDRGFFIEEFRFKGRDDNVLKYWVRFGGYTKLNSDLRFVLYVL